MQFTEIQVPDLNPDNLNSGRLSEEIISCKSAVAKTQDSWQRGLIYERLGALYQLAGKPENAVGAFESALQAHRSRNNPAVTRVYILLGLSLCASGNPLKALAVYEQGINLLLNRALKIIHDDGVLLGASPSQDDRTLLADPRIFARIRDLCRLDLTFAILRNNMGVIYAEQGAYTDAIQMFKEAQDFIPDGVQYDHPGINLSQLETT